jgi:hypothetical protein
VRGYRGPATRLQEGAGGINPFVPRDHERGKRQRPFVARSLVTFARAQKHTHTLHCRMIARSSARRPVGRRVTFLISAQLAPSSLHHLPAGHGCIATPSGRRQPQDTLESTIYSREEEEAGPWLPGFCDLYRFCGSGCVTMSRTYYSFAAGFGGQQQLYMRAAGASVRLTCVVWRAGRDARRERAVTLEHDLQNLFTCKNCYPPITIYCQ